MKPSLDSAPRLSEPPPDSGVYAVTPRFALRNRAGVVLAEIEARSVADAITCEAARSADHGVVITRHDSTPVLASKVKTWDGRVGWFLPVALEGAA